MAYHDKYKKILNEVWKDKVNKNALADTGSDINTMPFRIYVQLRREDMKKVGVTILIAKFLILDISIDRDSPIVVGRGLVRTISGIVNAPKIFFSTFDGFCHQTFRCARSDVMRNAESDSDNEEDYEIKRNKFGAPIYGPKPAPYLNCNDPAERSLAIQTVTSPFRKISVWKKAVSLFVSLPVPLKHVNRNPDFKGSYTKEEEATGQWRTEIRLTDMYGNICLQGFTPNKMDQKLSKYHKLWEHTMMRPDHHNPNDLENMKLWKRCYFHKFTMNSYYRKDETEMQSLGCDGEIDDMLRTRLREAGLDEEIFTSFYSTYEFDEVCADDDLQTKKIIKFRLGGRAHSLTLLEFARRLGLYQAVELEDEGFNVYFEGGLRSDEHFNAQDYWLSISQEENLGLSRSHTSTIRNPILRVIHKMITYGLCQRATGYDKVQKNDLWLLSMFYARHQNVYANVARVNVRWMKRKGAGTQKESQICYGQFISKIARKCRVLIEDVDGDMPRGDRADGVYAVISLRQYYQQYPPPPPQYLPQYQQQQQDDNE
ncbi:hypothetical protein Tco_0257592 [Tanacetum coccineum]